MIIKELVKIQELNFIKSNCNSLDFDGVNEDLLVTPSSNFDFEWTQPISIEAWIFAKQEPPPAFGINKWNGGATSKGWFLAVIGYNPASAFSGTPWFQLRNNVSGNYMSVYANQSLTFNAWNHLVLTHDGSGTNAGITFYINGVATSKPNFAINPALTGPLVGGTIKTSNDVTINSRTAPGFVYYCVNNTQLFRMWNVLLTPSEILELTNKTSVPQGTNLILDLDVGRSTFNGSEWEVPDQTGRNTVISRNMEINDLTTNCP